MEAKEKELLESLFEEYLALADEILDYDFGIDPMAPMPSEILPNFLWLGSRKDATNANKLNKLGVTHILTCASLCSLSDLPDDMVKYKINASDFHEYDIIQQHVKVCNEFINKCKKHKNGKILVHCMAGCNRSAAITTAYLLSTDGEDMHFLQAIEYIARRRESVLLNKGFKKQLIKYAHSMDKLMPYTFNKAKNNSNSCSCRIL